MNRYIVPLCQCTSEYSKSWLHVAIRVRRQPGGLLTGGKWGQMFFALYQINLKGTFQVSKCFNTFRGLGQSLITSSLTGSALIPSSETTWPRYWTLFCKRAHFLGLSLSLLNKSVYHYGQSIHRLPTSVPKVPCKVFVGWAWHPRDR